MARVTPDDARRVHFATPQVGHRGYDADQVDAFLDRVTATLAGQRILTADEVRRVAFEPPGFGSRGYRADQVDEFLDRVRVELDNRQRGIRPGPTGGVSVASGTAPLTPEDVRRVRFSVAPTGRRGYDVDEVDAFLDLVAATLAHDGPGTLTVTDVRSVRFTEARLSRRGYQTDEVEAFLDLVITAFEFAR
ncbi:DivIVA domain-containing protein [Nocardia arizonensis]|uniref:DivIVA domain-containing protein n=1 Tax=Nocardia arizonensis TaxID=1141647 RepID=UPI0006D029E1|nr:DivIVA domain-containing protein [Nocardia arizonensis]